MMKTCQQFGGALGVALVGSLYFATRRGISLPAMAAIEGLAVCRSHGAQPAPASLIIQ
jgi:hypothetical protein